MESITRIEESLENLEEVLEPLLGKPLHDTISQLDVIQKAKLQVVIPYVVNDLIFIYLKTRGINPKTHPVIGELDRAREYFAKIKNAEDPEKRKLVVDQEAAARFLKHALTQSQAMLERSMPNKQVVDIQFAEPTAAALAKIQARAAMTMEREADSSEESEDLEIFEGEVEQKESPTPVS